jgi:hypothetical protein
MEQDGQRLKTSSTPSRHSSGGNVQELGLDELLEIISGNVVSEKSHQRILRELLEGPVGIWRQAKELDREGVLTEEAQSFSSDLGLEVMEGLKLAWTLHPDDPGDRSFCAILFFYGRNDLLWHRLAIFNRNTL